MAEPSVRAAVLRPVAFFTATIPIVWGWLLPAYLLFDPVALASARERGLMTGIAVAVISFILARYRLRGGPSFGFGFRAATDLALLSAAGAIWVWLLTQLDDEVPYVESFSQLMLQVATGWAAGLGVFVSVRRALRARVDKVGSLPSLPVVFITTTTSVGVFAAVWLGVGSSGRAGGFVDQQQAVELEQLAWITASAVQHTARADGRNELLQPLTADPYVKAFILPEGIAPPTVRAALGQVPPPGRSVVLFEGVRWHAVSVPVGPDRVWLLGVANVRPPVRAPEDAPSLLILAFLVLGAPLAALIVAVDLRDELQVVTQELRALGPQAADAPEPLPVAANDEVGDLTVALNATCGRFVDENRRLAADLEAAAQQDRARNRLLEAASHELRTPLTSIIGYCHLVSSGPLEPAQAEDVRVIAEASEQLLGHVDEILDLSRIESGDEAPLEFGAVDLRALADDVVARVRREDERVALQVEGAAVTVRGDAQRLRQVLENLVGNALKFTAEGRVTVRVGPGTALSVVDTGPGIPPEELASIFTEFHRVRGEDAVVGTGLGLSIAQRLVEQHGGTLSARSEMGRGSVFIVELPEDDS